MRYPLDAHALLWWWTDDPQLSAHARKLIGGQGNLIVTSAASAWEIATKHRLGKLSVGGQAIAQFSELVEVDDFEHLPATRDAGDEIRYFSASTATSGIVSGVELRNSAVAADFAHSQKVCPQIPI